MLKINEGLYYHGLIYGSILQTQSFKQMLEQCSNILNENLLEGYELVKKYEMTLDLKPTPLEYHPCFVKFVEENNIMNLIQDHIGSDYGLSNIQVRIVSKYEHGPNKTYMPWHRDSYKDKNKITGFAPPGYKLIIYPDLQNTKDPVLSLIPGSHLQQKFVQEDDHAQIFNTKIDVAPNNDEYIFFNTALMHSTLPTKGDPNIRIIYNFIRINQMEDYHRDIYNKFLEIIND